METITMSSKGQLVLPAHIRRARGWGAGTKLVVKEKDGGVLLTPEWPFKKTTVDDVFGIAKYTGKPKTIEEMNAAVLEEAKRHA